MSDEQKIQLSKYLDTLKIKYKVEISSFFAEKGANIYITYNKNKYFDIVENVYNAIEDKITNEGYNINCKFLIFMISDYKIIDKKTK